MINLKTCTKAIDADPNNAALYLRRGAIYQGKGAYTRAIVDYTKAIILNPDYAHAYYLRGLSKYRRKDYFVDRTDIIKDLEKAIELGNMLAGRLKQEVQEIRISPYFPVMKWVKSIWVRKEKRKQASTRLDIRGSGLDMYLCKDPRKKVKTV